MSIEIKEFASANITLILNSTRTRGSNISGTNTIKLVFNDMKYLTFNDNKIITFQEF